ncbi:MAG: hypothetical protein MUP54_00615 [Candidatus Baumannia cicadellinicola]|nr:hypothetical protein [Candidatus Baumannia cicadellinicola]MCJ7462629.1 hypothetical protein [Candidatus Baumannia cicadellinicola]
MIPFSKNLAQFENLAIKLEQMAHIHGKLISQLQQQLIDNQHDIDILRGHIQESQYQLLQIIQQLNELRIQVNARNQSHSIPYRDKENRHAKKEYTVALAMLLNENKSYLVEQAFQRFMNTYPQSNYLPNAYYSLGQLNYNQGKKIEAIQEQAKAIYSKICKTYPNIDATKHKQTKKYLSKVPSYGTS